MLLGTKEDSRKDIPLEDTNLLVGRIEKIMHVKVVDEKGRPRGRRQMKKFGTGSIFKFHFKGCYYLSLITAAHNVTDRKR